MNAFFNTFHEEMLCNINICKYKLSPWTWINIWDSEECSWICGDFSFCFNICFSFAHWVFSRITAMPCPPPIQAEPTAYLPPRRLKTKNKIWQKYYLNYTLSALVGIPVWLYMGVGSTWAHEPNVQWFWSQRLLVGGQLQWLLHLRWSFLDPVLKL